nr:retrovirus-related Pol polyprotein from transposon TNT 1-94 [Tanacetum cinerariifolium]
NLGKFEAKGDEGYFIGYSMSRKAFRVFNKRTRKVEENLHVEFLENKAIETGAGLNWYKGCSKPKSEEVSSLRYIALPNWVYVALLESSSSKPQDDCSADVPESSRISNPTANSTNPPTDQLETLTVETLIPTLSSLSFIATIHQKIDPTLLQFCLFSCFLSQVEPKKISDALYDPS